MNYSKNENTLQIEKLSIREICSFDIPYVLGYWRETSEDDLNRMGELERPDENENQKFLLLFCEKGYSKEDAGEDILIWEVDEEPIAYCTLKQFKIPDYGQMHLHMWAKDKRGKGYGAVLFCLSALHFQKKYNIQNLYCAPKWDNPFPNRMLAKIGFPTTVSKNCIDWIRTDGSSVKQTKYYLSFNVIHNYLDQQSKRFQFSKIY
jgi:RimJ/RimL family protein N-acetyltransferase